MSVEALDNISCPIAPVADSHLANKAYVDAAVASGAGTASVSGDSVVSIPAHSLISCDIEPTEDSHLVNKGYVDAAVAAAGSATPIEEPAALGRVVYVDTLSDAADHTGTSLRDAIEAVTSNASVVIKFSVSGTITLEQGEIVIPVGNIAIDGEDKITISGGGVSRVFSMTNAYAVLSLHRLVITGGNGVGAVNSGQYGGAVSLNVASTIVARSVTFSANSVNGSTTVGGGAIYVSLGQALFFDCTFISNNAVSTEGVCNGGAIYVPKKEVTLLIQRCSFERNTASGVTETQGGAFCGYSGVFDHCAFIDNSTISGNTRRGGVAYVGWGAVVFHCCVFSGNSAGKTYNSFGGAICVIANYCVTVSSCTFVENEAYFGGAISLVGTSSSQRLACIRGCTFDGNIVVNRGGAIYISVHAATIEDCVFTNHAVGSASGVIYTYGYTDKPFSVMINRCKFTGNSTTAKTNGLIYCANLSDVYVYNSVFTGNSAATAGVNVALLYTTGTSTITAGNLTMTDNEKFRSFRAASGSISIYNSVDVGNAAVPTMTNVTAISPLTNWSYGAGRIAYDSAKPLFAADGYTPVAGSQVIDKGDDDYVETVYDLVGKARVSGTKVDVGAVEWQG